MMKQFTQNQSQITPTSLAHTNSIFKNADTIDLPITKIKVLTHDTSIYTLGFDKDQCVGTYTGAHIQFLKQINGDQIGRWFTPLTLPDNKGYTDILIKFYRPTATFPGGKLTTYLDTLKVGDKITCHQPKAKCVYLGDGRFFYTKLGFEQKFDRFAMVCGGSGITPVYQILQQTIANGEKIPIDVLFGNKSVGDILLENELNDLQKNNPHIKINFAVEELTQEQVNSGKYLLGKISPELMDKVLPKGQKGLLGYTCGPKPMHAVALQHFEQMGYPEDHIWKQ